MIIDPEDDEDDDPIAALFAGTISPPVIMDEHEDGSEPKED